VHDVFGDWLRLALPLFTDRPLAGGVTIAATLGDRLLCSLPNRTFVDPLVVGPFIGSGDLRTFLAGALGRSTTKLDRLVGVSAPV
jgi:hypothetical protein